MQTWWVDRSGLEDHFLPNLPHSHFWPVFLSPFFPNPLSPPRLVTEVSSSLPLTLSPPSLPSSTSLPSSPQSAGSPWTPCWSAAHGNALGHGLRCFKTYSSQSPRLTKPFFAAPHLYQEDMEDDQDEEEDEDVDEVLSPALSISPVIQLRWTLLWHRSPLGESPYRRRSHFVYVAIMSPPPFCGFCHQILLTEKRFSRATFFTVCLVLDECKFQPI